MNLDRVAAQVAIRMLNERTKERNALRDQVRDLEARIAEGPTRLAHCVCGEYHRMAAAQ